MKVSYFLVSPNVVPGTEQALNNSPRINVCMYVCMDGWMDADWSIFLRDLIVELALFPFMVEHSVWDPEALIQNKVRSYEA